MSQQLIFAIIVTALLSACEASKEIARKEVIQLVSHIQRADYEGDRTTLKRCYDALAPYLDNAELASRVRYWRGFAQWRRAINGFNDAVEPKQLEQDLRNAIDEFKVATEHDSKFVDAKVGLISCLGFLAFMNKQDQARAKELIPQILALEQEARAMAPDNPRLIWVQGPILWNTPPERGGGQDKAMRNYERGLEICSRTKPAGDPSEPSWGEPELMMSLAYSCMMKQPPDLETAERYARQALEIVPYWHYMRDILLPQILAAKAQKTKETEQGRSEVGKGKIRR